MPCCALRRPTSECWVARFGRVVDKLPGASQRGILYDTLVNTVRSQIPAARRVHPRQGHRHLDRRRSGRPSSCRTARRFPRASSCWRPASTSACARSSASTARSSAPAIRSRSASTSSRSAGRHFRFSALTYFAERPADRMAYITLFPIGAAMRANLFVYRDLHDPWLKQIREAPQRDALCDVAGPAQADGRLHGAGLRQDPSGRSLCHARAIGRPASCWSATPSRPRAPPPAPAPARCWSTSSGSATSTSRAGSPRPAWARPRSPRSTTTRSSRLVTPLRAQGLWAALVLDRPCAALGRDALGQVRRALGQGLDAAHGDSASRAVSRNARGVGSADMGATARRRTNSALRALLISESKI